MQFKKRELKLQQRKRHLELLTNIAKAEAQERAYAEAGAQETSNLFVLDQTWEDDESAISHQPPFEVNVSQQHNNNSQDEVLTTKVT